MKLRFRRHAHAYRLVPHPSGHHVRCAICGRRA